MYSKPELYGPLRDPSRTPRIERQESPGNQDGHYRGKVQPVDLINAQTVAGTIGAHEAIMIEYLCRWRLKGGIEDLEKVGWWLEQLMSIAQEITEKES